MPFGMGLKECRDSTKRQIVEARLKLEEYGQLRRTMEGIEAERAAAKATHDAAMSAIDDDRSALRRQLVDAELAGRPIPPGVESRLHDLEARLRRAADEHTDECRKIDGRRDAVQAELQRFEAMLGDPEQNPTILEGRLAGEYAMPGRREQLYASRQSCRWATARLKAAREAVALTEQYLAQAKRSGTATTESVDSLEMRLARHKAELAEASRRDQEVHHAADELRTLVISE